MKSRDTMNGGVDLDWIRAYPKAELHFHLLGAIRPATACDLANRHHTSIPFHGSEDLSKVFTSGNLTRFVEAFITLFDLIRTGEDLKRVAVEAFQDLAADGVRYVEPRVTITSHLSRGLSRREIANVLREASENAQKEWDLSVGWIIDFPRVLGPEIARQALEEAIDGQEWGVVGFDIAGDETDFDDANFLTDLFAKAHEACLGITVHAGETGSAKHVRVAFEEWKADRIGHGIGAVHDSELIAELADNQIPIEVCPTSNIALGSVDSLENHPLDQFRQAGIPIVLNTDDPALFGTTLSEEVFRTAQTLHWSRDVVEQVLENGWKYRFRK